MPETKAEVLAATSPCQQMLGHTLLWSSGSHKPGFRLIYDLHQGLQHPFCFFFGSFTNTQWALHHPQSIHRWFWTAKPNPRVEHMCRLRWIDAIWALSTYRKQLWVPRTYSLQSASFYPRWNGPQNSQTQSKWSLSWRFKLFLHHLARFWFYKVYSWTNK